MCPARPLPELATAPDINRIPVLLVPVGTVRPPELSPDIPHSLRTGSTGPSRSTAATRLYRLGPGRNGYRPVRCALAPQRAAAIPLSVGPIPEPATDAVRRQNPARGDSRY